MALWVPTLLSRWFAAVFNSYYAIIERAAARKVGTLISAPSPVISIVSSNGLASSTGLVPEMSNFTTAWLFPTSAATSTPVFSPVDTPEPVFETDQPDFPGRYSLVIAIWFVALVVALVHLFRTRYLRACTERARSRSSASEPEQSSPVLPEPVPIYYDWHQNGAPRSFQVSTCQGPAFDMTSLFWYQSMALMFDITAQQFLDAEVKHALEAKIARLERRDRETNSRCNQALRDTRDACERNKERALKRASRKVEALDDKNKALQKRIEELEASNGRPRPRRHIGSSIIAVRRASSKIKASTETQTDAVAAEQEVSPPSQAAPSDELFTYQAQSMPGSFPSLCPATEEEAPSSAGIEEVVEQESHEPPCSPMSAPESTEEGALETSHDQEQVEPQNAPAISHDLDDFPAFSKLEDAEPTATSARIEPESPSQVLQCEMTPGLSASDYSASEPHMNTEDVLCETADAGQSQTLITEEQATDAVLPEAVDDRQPERIISGADAQTLVAGEEAIETVTPEAVDDRQPETAIPGADGQASIAQVQATEPAIFEAVDDRQPESTIPGADVQEASDIHSNDNATSVPIATDGAERKKRVHFDEPIGGENGNNSMLPELYEHQQPVAAAGQHHLQLNTVSNETISAGAPQMQPDARTLQDAAEQTASELSAPQPTMPQEHNYIPNEHEAEVVAAAPPNDSWFPKSAMEAQVTPRPARRLPERNNVTLRQSGILSPNSARSRPKPMRSPGLLADMRKYALEIQDLEQEVKRVNEARDMYVDNDSGASEAPSRDHVDHGTIEAGETAPEERMEEDPMHLHGDKRDEGEDDAPMGESPAEGEGGEGDANMEEAPAEGEGEDGDANMGEATAEGEGEDGDATMGESPGHSGQGDDLVQAGAQDANLAGSNAPQIHTVSSGPSMQSGPSAPSAPAMLSSPPPPSGPYTPLDSSTILPGLSMQSDTSAPSAPAVLPGPSAPSQQLDTSGSSESIIWKRVNRGLRVDMLPSPQAMAEFKKKKLEETWRALGRVSFGHIETSPFFDWKYEWQRAKDSLPSAALQSQAPPTIAPHVAMNLPQTQVAAPPQHPNNPPRRRIIGSVPPSLAAVAGFTMVQSQAQQSNANTSQAPAANSNGQALQGQASPQQSQARSETSDFSVSKRQKSKTVDQTGTTTASFATPVFPPPSAYPNVPSNQPSYPPASTSAFPPPSTYPNAPSNQPSYPPTSRSTFPPGSTSLNAPGNRASGQPPTGQAQRFKTKYTGRIDNELYMYPASDGPIHATNLIHPWIDDALSKVWRYKEEADLGYLTALATTPSSDLKTIEKQMSWAAEFVQMGRLDWDFACEWPDNFFRGVIDDLKLLLKAFKELGEDHGCREYFKQLMRDLRQLLNGVENLGWRRKERKDRGEILRQ